MKLFDSSDNKCYISNTIGSNPKEIDYIGVIGYQSIQPGECYPKDGFPDVCLFKEHGGRYINEFQLIYIASGSGSFQDRGIHYEVHSGHFLLIQPGFWHSYSPDPNTGWEEYYFGFNGHMLSALAQDIYMINENNLLKVSEASFAQPILTAALRLGQIGDESEESNIILKSLLTQLLTELKYRLRVNDLSKESLVFKARQYMENHLSQRITIDDIAKHLHISNSLFRKEFQKQTGVPPVTFLNRIRLQTSKYLLLTSNKSIKEIAGKCGFLTSEYFCKFFRDNTNMTPSEFRERGHNNSSENIDSK